MNTSSRPETRPGRVEAGPPPAPADRKDRSRYFNRELSWLAFNERVLEEAANRRHPLLERLRFLSISGSNLDEFFMVRVAGLKGHASQGVDTLSVDGLSANQQLLAIAETSGALIDAQREILAGLDKELEEAGLDLLDPGELAELSTADADWLVDHFRCQLLPVLTPQALDPSHPFPFVPNRGLSVVFDLVRLSDGSQVRELVMIPQGISRFVRLPGEPARYVAMETLIRFHSAVLFPGFTVEGAGAFRILRDGDIEIEEEAEDLVQHFRSAIKRRRRGRVIRLDIEAGMSDGLTQLVRFELGDGDADVSEVSGLLGMADLDELVAEDRSDLKFDSFVARFPERIREYDGDCFAAIRAKDIVVQHPYETFDVVLAFLRQAAADPDVVAIKQTLYRAGKQSAVIRALIDAAEAGKSVTAVVELKARFDEEQNLMWAAALERAGVQVVYGFQDWKTHAKISMVVRREGDELATYCHFGTGNYHPVTARIYTDLSFFTADATIARDATQIFNYITGYIDPPSLAKLSMSPVDLRSNVAARIDGEIARAKAGQPSGIWAKMNSLVDPDIIDRLYAASAAGVPIDLIVRGICCLKPQVAGLSDTVRVRSVVGRFLEHSRIWAFGNGAALPNDGAAVFISSADWMPRNFDRRIEYMLPIENPTVHDQVLDQVLLANLLDTEQSWELQADGSYRRLDGGKRPFNLHRYFMNNPSLSGRGEALTHEGEVPTLPLPRHGPGAARE